MILPLPSPRNRGASRGWIAGGGADIVGSVEARVTLLEVILMALALSADAFSVALAVGLSFSAPRQVFRLSWHFGLFQALMPFLGAAGGTALRSVVGGIDHYVAFGVLAFLGGKMLRDAARSREGAARLSDPTRGWSLVGLSLATSIDAFGAGFGLALARASLLSSCAIIGATCALVTLAGMRLGSGIEPAAGRWAEGLGGIILIGLGVRMLSI